MTIPQCGAVRTGKGDQIALTGFDAVDAWAKDNDGVWRSLSRLAEIHQWSDIDRLRLIAATFMGERARMQEGMISAEEIISEAGKEWMEV